MNTQNNRHTDVPRSMELAAACIVLVVLFVGMVAGFVLRPFVLGAL